MSLHDQTFTRNGLLCAISPADFALLQPHLQRVELPQGHYLVPASRPIEFVYFLESGVASIVTDLAGEEIEVGLFGREGMSGTSLLLGAGSTPDKTFMQIGGATALRIAAEPFIEATRQSESLRLMLLRFVQILRLQTARTAASNASLEIVRRLARWLLMCHDRVDGDMVGLTHEFMATMLAVRRSGVTVALHAIQDMRAISATRGAVAIVDRARLEALAGEAYGVPEAEYRRLIGPFGKDAGPRTANVAA